MELLIGLISGAIGGNVAGGVLKKIDLGILGNSFAGVVGGGIGSQILGMLGTGGTNAGDLDFGSVIGQIAFGGVGGGALLAIIGVIKGAIGK